MDKAIQGQLDLVFTSNQGKTDQRGIDLFKKEEAACPFLPELFQTYLLFLGSWGIRGRYTRNKQAELAAIWFMVWVASKSVRLYRYSTMKTKKNGCSGR